MAANVKGGVMLGAHNLRFGINQLCDIEAKFEKPAVEVFAEMQTAPRMTTFRTLFAIGLGLSETDAGNVIDDVGGLSAASEKLMEAFTASFPDVAGDDADPPKAARQTG